MAQKYTALSNVNSTSRFTNVDKAFTTLSDGTAVWIDFDPNANQFALCYSSDHASRNVIGTWTTTGIFYTSGAHPQSIMLVRDSSDNLYVIGTDASNAGRVPLIKAWNKGSGYTWTAQTPMGGTNLAGTTAMECVGAAWCNIGTGYVIAIFAAITSTTPGYAVFSCSVAKAGSGTVVTTQSNFPSFFGGGGLLGLSAASATVDLAQDGFGAASGICVWPSSASALGLGAWAVDSTGALSTSLNVNSAAFSSGALTSSAKARATRYASNAWAVCYPSNTATGHWNVGRCSSSALLTGGTDSGTPTNMPLNGLTNNTSWDIFVDPSTANKVWVITPDAIDGSGNQKIWRTSVDVSSGVTWASAAVLDDTFTGLTGGVVGSDFRATRQQSGQIVDYQVSERVDGTPNYALVGDFTSFGGNPICMII